MEDLALLGALDGKLAFGTMNRGGIMGAAWELDDRMTAYSAAALAANGLDGGKVLLRLADDDAGTAPTLEACARAVDECAANGLPIMVEPLPYHHEPTTGQAKLLEDEDALAPRRRRRLRPRLDVDRDVAQGPGRQEPASHAVVHDAAGADPRRHPGLRSRRRPTPPWVEAMEVPNVRGLVVGRALLYPPDGDVAGAIERAAGIVAPERSRPTREP